MNYKGIGYGLGAFAAGAIAWTVTMAAFGPRAGSRPTPANARDEGSDAVSTRAVRPPVGSSGTGDDEAPVGQRTGHSAAEHVPTDLMGDRHPGPGDRAVDAFRPDPAAVPTSEEREALRPATGPAPTLVADRGSSF